MTSIDGLTPHTRGASSSQYLSTSTLAIRPTTILTLFSFFCIPIKSFYLYRTFIAYKNVDHGESPPLTFPTFHIIKIKTVHLTTS